MSLLFSPLTTEAFKRYFLSVFETDRKKQNGSKIRRTQKAMQKTGKKKRGEILLTTLNLKARMIEINYY